MAPRKKKSPPPRKAAKTPVLNLKATEVKSEAGKSANKPAEKTDDAKKSESACKPADKKTTHSATKPASKKTARPEQKPDNSGPAPKGKNDKTKTLTLVSLAALLAAGLGGAWVYKTYGSKMFGDPNVANSQKLDEVVSRIGILESAGKENSETRQLIADLKKQVADVRASLLAHKQVLAENKTKLAGLEKTASEIRVALAKAVEDDKGPAAVANELQFKALSEKIATLEAGLNNLAEVPSNDNSEALGSLKTRFEALLIRLNATEEQATATAKSIDLVRQAQEKIVNAPGSNPASELARAFTILRANVGQGTPFEAALDQIAGMVPQEKLLDVLRPFAKSGAPTLAGLTSGLEKVDLSSGASASGSNDNQSDTVSDSILGGITNRLSGLVTVTKVGETDWAKLKAAALAALKAREIGRAIEILKSGSVPTDGVVKWLTTAENKTRIDDAIEQISATVVARLTNGNK